MKKTIMVGKIMNGKKEVIYLTEDNRLVKEITDLRKPELRKIS